MDVVLIVVAVIGWVISLAGKAAKQQQKEARRRDPRVSRPEGTGAPPVLQPAQPSVRSPEQEQMHPPRDDARYLGGTNSLTTSLMSGAEARRRMSFTTEGEDPCHDDLYADRTLTPATPTSNAVTAASAAQPVAIPGLQLVFNRDSLVNGVVFSEILNRRTTGRTTSTRGAHR